MTPPPAASVTILGAAFDPIHYGHIGLALEVLTLNYADSVWLTPSPDRWDKQPLAPAELRFEWADLCAQQMRAFGANVYACREEIDLGAYRGSFEFLNYLSKKYSKTTFSFVLGTDAFSSILQWRDPTTNVINGHELLDKYKMFLVEREGPAVSAALLSHPNVTLLPPMENALEQYQEILPLPALAAFASTDLRADMDSRLTGPFIFPEVQERIIQSRRYDRA